MLRSIDKIHVDDISSQAIDDERLRRIDALTTRAVGDLQIEPQEADFVFKSLKKVSRASNLHVHGGRWNLDHPVISVPPLQVRADLQPVQVAGEICSTCR